MDECGEQSSCCQQDCTNYPGGYECYCSAGYRLGSDGCGCEGTFFFPPSSRPRLTLKASLPFCSDVDECLAVNGGCEHTCQNSAGSFHCSCRRGFRLDEDRQSCAREYQANLRRPGSGPLATERLTADVPPQR